MSFDLSLYDEDFFLWHKTHAREYSIRNMDWYIQNFQPTSVVDFGCGIGSYIESANSKGIFCRGYEISEEAKTHTPDEIKHLIRYQDCTQPMTIGKFDCVLSFETAEHIDPAGTDQFIDNLINATNKTLLFTAAPPGQEGTGHINCHPKQFWIDKFSKTLVYNERLTILISSMWASQGAPYYIIENLIALNR